MIKCAILIVNWNSWELLKDCLDALDRQTCQDFTVLVGDNASKDQIPAGMRETYPEVNFHFFTENHGFAKGNNRLLALVGAIPWVILLNPDAFPKPDWFEKMVSAAKIHSEYSFFSSRLLVAADPERLDGDGDVYHISGLAWRSGHGQQVAQSEPSREVFAPCAAAAMYPTERLREIGGFDEDFFCYFEDVDLGFRLRLLGDRCWHVADALVLHVGSATSGGRGSDFSVYYGHRNLVWTFIKNMPGWLFYLFLPLHLVLNILAVVVLATRGQGMVALRSKTDAVKGLWGMWRKRKAIQAGRIATCSDLLKVMSKQFFTGRGVG